MKRLHSNRRRCSCPGLRSEAGVTLIELMIYMVLASVVMGAIYSMMITQTRAYADQRQITDAQVFLLVDFTFSRHINTSEDFEQGGFSGAVTAHDSYTILLMNGEVGFFEYFMSSKRQS